MSFYKQHILWENQCMEDHSLLNRWKMWSIAVINSLNLCDSSFDYWVACLQQLRSLSINKIVTIQNLWLLIFPELPNNAWILSLWVKPFIPRLGAVTIATLKRVEFIALCSPFFSIPLSFDMVGYYVHMHVVNNNKSSSTGDKNSLVSWLHCYNFLICVFWFNFILIFIFCSFGHSGGLSFQDVTIYWLLLVSSAVMQQNLVQTTQKCNSTISTPVHWQQ